MQIERIADSLYTLLQENEAHFWLQFKKKIKNNASLSRKAKCQIFNL